MTDVAAVEQTAAELRRDDVRAAWRRRGWVLLAQVLILVGVVGLWELAHSAQWGNPVLVTSPGQVWDFLVESVGNGDMGANLWATLKATLIAFVIGSVAGIAAGVVLGITPILSEVLAPYVNALNSMPRIALAPLFIVIFGIGTSAKVALAVTLVFFILLESAYAGIQSVESDILRLSEAMGANPWQRFVTVLLPVAVPSIFAGLRLGLTYSLLGVVSSEIISAEDGLGQLVAYYSGTYVMAGVYASLIVMAIAAALLNMTMRIAERKLLSWRSQ